MTHDRRTRRWTRWSLRTLLLTVTLAGICSAWVVYQLNWIRQRNEAMLEWHKRLGCGPIVALQGRQETPGGPIIRTNAPWSIRVLGAEGYEEIAVGVADGTWTSEDFRIKDQIERLFPEARVVFYIDPTSSGSVRIRMPAKS